jgi:hypothetical protein
MWKVVRLWYIVDNTSVFFTCEFSPNFDLQNIVLTYTKGYFSRKKNDPNSPDFFFIKKDQFAKAV